MAIEEKKKYNDFIGAILLFFLYLMQGLILGFFGYTIAIIFAEKRIPLSVLAPLSFTQYPYTLKVLFAPFLDAYYWPKFGNYSYFFFHFIPPFPKRMLAF
jgi:PAT family acetyl-CoA transporter-like MFS transporter 1